MSKKETQVVKEVVAEPTPKVTGRWGTSEAKWFMEREDAGITVHMRGDKTLIGFLVGVDNYSIFLEITEPTKKILLVPKHAIDYAEDV